MTSLAMFLSAALGAAAAVPPDRLPPQRPAAPDVRDLGAEPAPAIFTYRIDDRCRVSRTRMLQGPGHLIWRDVERARAISTERTVFRMLEGQRTQLIERRVKLLGEMVLEGELVCLVRPRGGVVDAWIIRQDGSAARRRAPTREDVAVRDSAIAELGTFSVTLEDLPPQS